MLTRYELNLSWVVCNREIMSSCFNPCLLNIVSGIIKSRRMSLCVCVCESNQLETPFYFN